MAAHDPCRAMLQVQLSILKCSDTKAEALWLHSQYKLVRKEFMCAPLSPQQLAHQLPTGSIKFVQEYCRSAPVWLLVAMPPAPQQRLLTACQKRHLDREASSMLISAYEANLAPCFSRLITSCSLLSIRCPHHWNQTSAAHLRCQRT